MSEQTPREKIAAIREQLEDWSFLHRPVIRYTDGRIAGCICMDRVFVNDIEDWDLHIADALLVAFPQLTEPVKQKPVLQILAEQAAKELDPEPWVSVGVLNPRFAAYRFDCYFDPRPEFVQDRAAYEPSPTGRNNP